MAGDFSWGDKNVLCLYRWWRVLHSSRNGPSVSGAFMMRVFYPKCDKWPIVASAGIWMSSEQCLEA